MLKRKMSEMSFVLANGAFPEEVGADQHPITVVMYTTKLPPRHSVVDVGRRMTDMYDRLRSIPIGAYFQEVEVTIDDHVTELTIPETEVRDLLTSLVNQGLPRSRPLWEIILVNVESDDGTKPQQLLCFRIDHCVADGVSMVEVFSHFVTDLNNTPLTGTGGLIGLKRPTPRDDKTRARRNWMKELSPWYSWTILPVIFFSYMKHLLLTFIKLLPGFACAFPQAFGAFDTDTILKSDTLHFCKQQHLGMVGPLPLAAVKKVKTAWGGTVNDVLLCCVSGAIRRYCIERGDTAFKNGEVILRNIMPVAFLKDVTSYRRHDSGLGNNWTFMSTTMMIQDMTSQERLAATAEHSRILKSRLQPLANRLVAYIGSFLPDFLKKTTIVNLYRRHSVCVANVAGPSTKIKFCGIVIEQAQVLFANVLPQVELYTYAGQVFFNVVADPNLLKRPQRLADLFADELEKMVRLIGIEKPKDDSTTCSSQ